MIEAVAAMIVVGLLAGPAQAQHFNQVAKLAAADAAPDDRFGTAVAIDGDTAVVGAPDDDDAGDQSGSAYVFVRDATSIWQQVKKLTAADAAAGDRFGRSVAISGDTVVIGASDDDDAGDDSGSAYVFDRNDGGTNDWGEVKKLTAADAAAGDRFGTAVAISGDSIVIGAPAFGSASAYVFERNDGGANNWGEVKKLTDPDPPQVGSIDLALRSRSAATPRWSARSPDHRTAPPASPTCSSATMGVQTTGVR